MFRKHNCMCCKRAIPPFQWWISTRQKVIYIHVNLLMIQCSQNLKGLIVVFKGGGIHAQDTTKEGLFYIIS